MKLRKNDLVLVTSGKEKGKTGKIEKIFTSDAKVLVEGLNLYKRHVKARTQGQKSEIVTISKPLPVGNVALVCPKCKKQTRIAFMLVKDVKQRVCSKCKAEI
ncbi:MAG: 50S ribosomal protein L24 [Candidatus Levybacteria bacterium]|nr:50S ribosomal protein L24 [Candidatus Levybacteria bacterium]